MDQDDPEERIRALERPLAARASEVRADDTAAPQWPTASYPPPPPGPPTPWPGYPGETPTPSGSGRRIALLSIGGLTFLAAMGTAGVLLLTDHKESSGASETSRTTTARTYATYTTATTIVPSPADTPAASTPAPDETVVLSGIDEHHTVECTGNVVLVSGIENTVTLTGHCTGVTISGIQNTVVLDEADTIDVSGIENRVTYHAGTPQIGTSGSDNTVEQG